MLETISGSKRDLDRFQTNLSDFEGICLILKLFEQSYRAFGTIGRLSLEHCNHEIRVYQLTPPSTKNIYDGFSDPGCRNLSYSLENLSIKSANLD